ncbi:MAG TPA: Fe-S oxidoreductase [Sphingobium sp.]|nr:Fe-S oxidoreductase [Sphingobium sp.]
MKSIMLAGAALLAFSTGATGIAIAQGVPDSAAQPPATDTMPADQAAPATPADPNAGQPTGAVPADPGMAPASPAVPKDPAAPMGSPANPVTVGGNMTPPPAGGKDYPLCSRTVQDSCINPSEAPRSKKMRRHR